MVDYKKPNGLWAELPIRCISCSNEGFVSGHDNEETLTHMATSFAWWPKSKRKQIQGSQLRFRRSCLSSYCSFQLRGTSWGQSGTEWGHLPLEEKDRPVGNPEGDSEQAGETSSTSMCHIPREELVWAALQYPPYCHMDGWTRSVQSNWHWIFKASVNTWDLFSSYCKCIKTAKLKSWFEKDSSQISRNCCLLLQFCFTYLQTCSACRYQHNYDESISAANVELLVGRLGRNSKNSRLTTKSCIMQGETTLVTMSARIFPVQFLLVLSRTKNHPCWMLGCGIRMCGSSTESFTLRTRYRTNIFNIQ